MNLRRHALLVMMALTVESCSNPRTCKFTEPVPGMIVDEPEHLATVGDFVTVFYRMNGDISPHKLTIQPDGCITMPFMGKVFLRGLTSDQVREKIESEYRRLPPESIGDFKLMAPTVCPYKPRIDLSPIKAGEILEVKFSGVEALPVHEERVHDNGRITMPLLGDISVAGLTLREAQEKITQTYRATTMEPPRRDSFFVELKRP